MNKLLVSLTIIVCCQSHILAQEMVFDWVDVWSTNAGSDVYPEHVTLSGENHLWVNARLLSTSDVDPGDSTRIIPQQYAESEVFLRFTTDGQLMGNSAVIHADDDLVTKANVTDKAGNLYVVGYFEDTLFAEVKGNMVAKPVDTSLTPDAFVLKIDTQGVIQWINTYGDIFDDKAQAVAVDDSGNVYIAGYFAENTQFDPNGAVEYSSWYDLFVVKLNPDGDFQWLYRTEITGRIPELTIADLEVDANGKVYVWGHHVEANGDSLDFKYGPGTSLIAASSSNKISFLLQLDAVGQFVNVRGFQSTNMSLPYCEATAMEIDPMGNLILAGKGRGKMRFDANDTSLVTNLPGSYNYFVAKLDTMGNQIWANVASSDNTLNIEDLTVDGMGNIIFTGDFTDSADIDPGPDTLLLTPIPGASFDIMLVKYDANGKLSWGEKYGTNGTDRGWSVTTNVAGELFGCAIAAAFPSDTIQFGNFMIPTVTNRFLYKLRPCGAPTVEQMNDSTLKTTVLNATYQWIDCGNPANILAGDTHRIFTPDTSGTYALITSNYGCVDTSACYTLSLIPSCQATTDSIIIITCNSYTSPSGRLLNKSDIYTDIITNSGGCDSIITIDLTINTVDTSVSYMFGVWIVEDSNATYQWLDCDNGHVVISGATNQSFSPNTNGNYAVEVTRLGCVDTSSCNYFGYIGIAENVQRANLSIYPNPNAGKFTVTFSNHLTNVTLTLRNILGQVIYSEKPEGSTIAIDLQGATGIYFLEITSEQKLIQIAKVVCETP